MKRKYYGFESSTFPIHRGTHQGCLLSSLLFILAVEPLAEAIQSHADVRGIEVAGSSHKISLFADDKLLTLTSPRVSLPNLLSFLDNFAYFLGPCVNPAKLKAMYCDCTVALNIWNKLYMKLTELLSSWSLFLLFWFGTINAKHMTSETVICFSGPASSNHLLYTSHSPMQDLKVYLGVFKPDPASHPSTLILS